jgi:ornithine lipid ester-linked acyl 2-hydroxylase
MNAFLEEFEKVIRAHEGQKTFFDPDSFPWVKEVEAHWPAMRQELDRVLAAVDLLPGFEEIQTEQTALTQDGRWKIFPLYVYGQWIEANERRCPESARALKKIPALQAAMFSIMQGQKELPPHRGVFGGVLRYHLGLKVPSPASQCGICVGGDYAHWEEGKSLIFDDSHLHHAWNHSKEDRVVLFVDFTRPLPAKLSTINENLINSLSKSAFIENAPQQWARWEDKYGQALDQALSIPAL